MFKPFRFLWKQLNGPQITAFTQAIYTWIKNQFDKTLDYFNTWSLNTATSNHLTLMGTFSGFYRPIIDLSNVESFYFTDGALHDYRRGFGDLNAVTPIGGRLTDLTEGETRKELLPTEIYRSLLLMFTADGSGLNSLYSLDQVLNALWKAYRSDAPAYHIDIIEDDTSVEGMSAGDIHVYLGTQQEWGDNVPYVDAILRAIRDYVFDPQPQVFYSYVPY